MKLSVLEKLIFLHEIKSSFVSTGNNLWEVVYNDIGHSFLWICTLNIDLLSWYFEYTYSVIASRMTSSGESIKFKSDLGAGHGVPNQDHYTYDEIYIWMDFFTEVTWWSRGGSRYVLILWKLWSLKEFLESSLYWQCKYRHSPFLPNIHFEVDLVTFLHTFKAKQHLKC